MITINNPAPPEEWIPSGGNIIYTISSTNAAQPGFYFLINVYVNGTSKIILRRAPLSGNSVTINLRELITSILTSSTDELLYSGDYTPTDKCQIYIVVTEYYSGQPQDERTSVPINIWDAVPSVEWMKNNSHMERFSYHYMMMYDATKSGYFMAYNKLFNSTNLIYGADSTYLSPAILPEVYDFARGTQHKLTIFNPAYASTWAHVYAVMCGFDKDGKLIKKCYNWVSGGIYRTITIDTHNATGWNYKSGVFTDFDDCTYVAFYYASSATTSLTNQDVIISRIWITKLCTTPEYFTVIYKSTSGSWGQIQCNHRAIENTSVRYTTKEDLQPATMTKVSKMRSVVNVKAQSSWTLNTNWVDDGTNEDIKDMIMSPIQYILHYKDGSTEYIPVVLSDSDFITKNIDSKKLFNYKFNFVEAYNKNTIRQ